MGDLIRGLVRVSAPAGCWTVRPAVVAQEIDWDFAAPHVPKSRPIRRNVLFRACAEKELRNLVAASDEARFTVSAVVIRHGDKGDLFCVVEAGALDVLAAAAGADGPAAAPRAGS